MHSCAYKNGLSYSGHKPLHMGLCMWQLTKEYFKFKALNIETYFGTSKCNSFRAEILSIFIVIILQSIQKYSTKIFINITNIKCHSTLLIFDTIQKETLTNTNFSLSFKEQCIIKHLLYYRSNDFKGKELLVIKCRHLIQGSYPWMQWNGNGTIDVWGTLRF